MAAKRKATPAVALVAVVWVDAVYRLNESTEPLVPVVAVTVGKTISMGKDYVTVAAETFADGDHRQVTSIPRGMVKRIIPLKTLKLPEFADA